MAVRSCCWKRCGLSGWTERLSSALAPWRKPLAVHDPAKILCDLALALTLGGDCLADVALLRESPVVFGGVASDPTVSRLIDTLAAGVCQGFRTGPRVEPARVCVQRAAADSGTRGILSPVSASRLDQHAASFGPSRLPDRLLMDALLGRLADHLRSQRRRTCRLHFLARG